MTTATLAERAVRALAPDDLGAVVAIDAAIEGHSRRPYFERRLAAARREPSLHAQFAAEDERGISGYILARVLEGEFGHNERSLRIEIVGVRPEAQGRGTGRTLLSTLMAWARRHGIADLRTQADWRDARMLRWLDAMGFSLARNHVVDCAVDGGSIAARRAAVSREASPAAAEIDYGAQSHNDYERLERDAADVRSMQESDLADIARVDRHITGVDRAAYIRHKLIEALADSGIRISLSARVEGSIVGYLMASADLGDFGRTEPVAVLDTIGVHPDFAHHGLGHAMLSQLFVNLAALRIERVETVVAPHDLELLGFLYDIGFVPSQRLPFVKAVD